MRRNLERIDPLLDKIREVWKEYPDLRLAQLIVILANPPEACPGVFYLEDDALLERLERFREEHS